MNNLRTLKDYLLLTIKGIAMGAADVVPGVSGGTIALITGIYDELLASLKRLGPASLRVLYKEGFTSFWRYTNASFLLAVFGGALLSLKSLALLVSYCLDNYSLLVWGFFSGLIAASTVLVGKAQRGWRVREWSAFFSGVAFVVVISLAKPAQLPAYWWVVFLGGFIAICAMILPGISGSFILLLLGLYPVFLSAINELDVVLLVSIGAGCVSGLLVFSRLLSWLLERYYKVTLATLIGFLVGSLNVTWPWKQTLTTTLDRHGNLVPLMQKNVSPGNYSVTTGLDSQLIEVTLYTCLGVVLVLSVEFLASKISK